MKAGKYCFKELFVNRYVERIIVPEIQRDYVWQKEQVLGLLSSITKDYKKYINAIVPKIDSKNNEDIIDFNHYYKRRKYASSIGFIYAYSDESYSGKYFLIDGQQRVTTIYLLLAVLANRNQELRDLFNKNYCLDTTPKLGYKVRLIADELLNKFISHIVNQTSNVKEELWLLDAYKNDLTGKNLLENYTIIQTFLNSQNIDNEQDFFNYIEHFTEFWYFDTNISEQGEELYIYMNARGEHMQNNENIKADLLSKLTTLEEKNKYGKKWEDWQDFFWKKKNKNPNADKGFNNFLACIAGLELYLKNDKTKYYSKDKFDKSIGIKAFDITSVLTIETINKHIDSLDYLFSNKEVFKSNRGYSDWVDLALDDFWNLINDSTINWFANYEDNNRSTERNAMVYVWSVLLYLTERKKTGLFITETYRLLRIYYLRYNNFIRSVTFIKTEVMIQVKSGIWKDPITDLEGKSTQEERYKIDIYNNCNPNEINKIEELIWEIEDHPFNLNGKDVGNTNLTHLLNVPPQNISIEYLTLVKNKFYEVFPVNASKEVLIKRIEVLLSYGKFYDKVSPYYYLNFKFNNWRRIIRNISTELLSNDKPPFATFFEDFLVYEDSFNDFYIEKSLVKIKPESALTIRERILYYNQTLNSKMWNQGFNIAISLGNPCGLEAWDEKDEVFTESHKYYNTKGNLKGGSPQILSNLI